MFDEHSSNPPRTLATEAEAERSEEVDLGSGAERKGGSARGARGSVPDKAGTLARWLAHFYGDKPPARREQVREQLSALYHGQDVRLRKTIVRARSVEHLERCAAEMLDVGFTIRDPDKAIVVLLTKLQDPEKDALGRLPSEAMAEQLRADDRESHLYHKARRDAVAAWQRAHPDEAREVLAAVDAEFPPNRGDVVNTVRDAAITRMIGERLDFPGFERWLEQRKAS